MRITKVESYFSRKNGFLLDTGNKSLTLEKSQKPFLSNAEKRKITFLKLNGYQFTEIGA